MGKPTHTRSGGSASGATLCTRGALAQPSRAAVARMRAVRRLRMGASFEIAAAVGAELYTKLGPARPFARVSWTLRLALPLPDPAHEGVLRLFALLTPD